MSIVKRSVYVGNLIQSINEEDNDDDVNEDKRSTVYM